MSINMAIMNLYKAQLWFSFCRNFILIHFLFCLSLPNSLICQNNALELDTISKYLDSDVEKEVLFEKNFKTKYTSKDFDYKRVNKNKQSTLSRWLSKFFERFSGNEKKDGKKELNIFINFLFGLLLLFAVYLIATMILEKDKFWLFRKSNKINGTQYENINPNLIGLDFQTMIEAAVKDGNLKLAIRYHYLSLLKTLDTLNHIKYHPEKTNDEYYYEIKNKTVHSQFTYLTYIYDHVWYGEFEIDLDSFEKVDKTFTEILVNLKTNPSNSIHG